MNREIPLPKGNGLHTDKEGKRGESGGGWARFITRVTGLVALGLGVFAGVGMEVCLKEEMWTRHIWLPSLLIIFAAILLAACLLQAIKRRL